MSTSDVDKETVGIAVSTLLLGWATFGLTLLVGAVILCVKFDICLFWSGRIF